MKKKDKILMLILFGLAGICLAVVTFFPTGNKDMVRIRVNEEVYGEYSLSEDQKIKINETNVCEISGGEVRMIQADCPDQLCIHQKALDKKGQGTIICLPNKVVIEVIRSADKAGEMAPDAIAG